jgi:N-acetyl-anhydromuramyl-L-alanine amidase AmpD
MAVDLDTEVKRRKMADSLTNGGDEPDSADSTEETDSTDETDSTKETAAPEEPAAEPAAQASRREAGFLSFSDYSGTPAASPTPAPSAADRIGPFTHAIAEDQPVADYVPAPAAAQPAQPETAVAATQPEAVPAGHIDLGPPGRNIYTASDTGARYVIDPGTGQMVPHAELATAADKAAQPPGTGLPEQMTEAFASSPEEGLPVPQDQVRRAQLVKLPAAVQPAPDRLTQVERGELVKLPTQPAPDTLSQVEKGIALPPKVQPAQPVAQPQAPVTQQVPPPASARQAAGFLSFDDYAHPKPAVAQQPTAAQQPAAPGQVSAEPQIDTLAQNYTRGRTQPVRNIVMHSTDGWTLKGDTEALSGSGEPGHRVSVHYLIGRDGSVQHFVPEGDSAWQAGVDRYGKNGNDYSIGIEQQHVDGKQDWPDAQVRAAAQTAAGILARHPNMTIDDVIGHSDLAGERKQDPVDYPWDKFRKYVAEAQGQPAADTTTTAAAPSAQPVTKLKNGFYQDEKPSDFLTGPATTFATPQDIATGQDNGVGAPRMGKLDTTQVAGVAIPEEALRAKYGNNYAAWRQARVDVVDPSTGKRLRLPVVDFVGADVAVDMTPFVSKYFGGDKNLAVKLVDNAGPDVVKNPQLFYDEQAAIKNGFDSSTLAPKRQVIGPQFATRAQTPEEAAAAQQKVQQAIQQQKDLITKLPEADSGNIIGLYKRLDDPVDGVTGPMRQAMQANLKPQIIAAMREKFPDLKSDEEAWTKAQSDVGPLEIGAEAWNKVIGGFQEYTSVLQKGVAGTDQLHVNQFIDQAMPGASDSDKHAYLTKLYAMPEDQRIAEVQSHLLQPQTGIPSTDPQQIVSALDRLSSPDFQKQQAAELATAQADMKRNLTTDPRLKGTDAEKVVNAVAQMPSFLAAYRNPVMLPLVLAQTSDAARTQLRADHPDWDEKTISENAVRATAVMFFGQEAGAMLMGSGGGALLNALEGIGKRAIAQALLGIGGGAAISGATQAGVNVATGAPVGRGVGEAATAGAIQGGVTGLVHGGGELVRPPERAAAVEPPPVEQRPTEEPQVQPVARSDILGPETPDTMPWHAPGPIVTRAEQPEAFSPSQLAEAVTGMRAGGTPEEMRQAAEQLQPPADFRERGVYLGDVGQVEIDQAMAAQARQNLYPIDQQGNPKISESEPWVSQIANRFTAERMASGELGPVAPGVGVTKEEMLARGLKMGPEEIAQHVSNVNNDVGGNPRDQAAAIRTEEARLSQVSHNASLASEAAPNNAQLRIDADNAFKDLTDFHNGPVAKLKNNWHAQGVSLQGEIPVDLSSYNGLRDAYLRDVGKPPPPSAEPAMRAAAKRVRAAADAESAAMRNLGAEIERQSARRRLPTDEEVRQRIMERTKDMPCST